MGIHCMNHRLELSFRDAAKATNCHKKLSALLLGLYLFYKNSPLNRANLFNSFKALGKKPLVPARVCGTRWVGHMQKAVDNFLKGYKAIVQHLQQIQSPDAQGVRGDQQAKAKNFFQLATSLSIVRYACFLDDVLHHLKNLSNSLQSDQICVSEVNNSLEMTKSALETFREMPAPGSWLHQVEEGSFEDVQLKGTDCSFTSSSQLFLNKILASLDNRFEDMGKGVLEATSIFSFKAWPNKANMKDFGKHEVGVLAKHFHKVLEEQEVDASKLLVEWVQFRDSLYKRAGWEEHLRSVTWREMNRLHGETCSNILHLADLVLTLPASTAVCERGFSHLKRTKTDFRSKLGASALRDSLLTTLHTPGVEEFDPLPAAQLWASGAHRRPSYKRKATSSSASTSAIDDIEEEAQEVEDDGEEEEEEEDSEERAYLNKLLDQCTHDDFFDI